MKRTCILISPMAFCCSLLALLCARSLSAHGEDAPLFRATFDGYNTAAEVAGNKAKAGEGILPDLQMRMDSGEPGMGNVLSLTTPEFVAWPLAGNMRPDRGTVSFWVRMVNYTLKDAKNFQMFFSALGPGFEFFVYKYSQAPDRITFYIRSGSISKFASAPVKLREGEWYRIVATWDPNAMAVYVNGVRAGLSRFDSPFELPRELAAGRMYLNQHERFNPHIDGHETSFDDLRIFDRRLSAQEIFEDYRRIRPDAKPDQTAVEEKEDVRLTYRVLPRERKLVANLDLFAVKLPRETKIPAKISLVDRADKSVAASSDVVFEKPDSPVELGFGASLVEGHTYDLVAEVPEVKVVSRAKLHFPEMSFLKHRAGVDASVPAPWTAVKTEGKDAFSVLDRTYRFSRGILPSSITCRGEEMLAEAPRFVLDGSPVEWERPRLVENRGDRVTLAAKGAVGTLEVRGRADLWFDGYCEIRVGLRPGATPVVIDALSLEWAVPAAAARYLMTPVYRKWNGDRYDGVFGEAEYTEDQFLWTSGIEKGLCWWCESTANWVGAKNRKNLHVVRDEAKAKVSVELISGSADLRRDADYVMAFQATPAKHPDRLDRDHSYSAGGSFGDWTTGGWGIERGRPAADNMRNWTSYVPLDPTAFGKYISFRRQHGMTILSYGQPALISVKDEPWDYFNAEWCRMPYTRGSFRDLDQKPVSVYFGCGQTGVADWHLGNIEKLLQGQPELGGLYFDISDVKFCNNTQHGHGGTDAFGRAYSVSTARATRQYFLRVVKLCRQYGRRLHVHAHNKYYPFVHSFADSCWPGEEQYYAYAQNPENHYLEGISEEEYQSAWSPTIRGMNVYFIAQNSRASDFGENAGKSELFFSRRAVMGSMMSSLLHDFKALGGCYGKEANPFADSIFRKLVSRPPSDAVFHGYWFDPHAETAKGVRTALYTWTRGGTNDFLLVVGNTSREARTTDLKLDWSKTGCRERALSDLLSGQTKTEAEWAAHSLPSHEFLLLVP